MSECGSKTCLICKETLDLNCFGKANTKDGKRPWCFNCTKEYKKNYYLANREQILDKCRLRRAEKIESIREYDRQRGKEPLRRRRGTTTWRGKAVSLLAGMRSSSKIRKHDWDEEWWSTEKIVEEIEGKSCPMTGIPFAVNAVGEKLYKTNPFGPSPDRIDNTKGYEPENVRFVSWFYNNMKRDHSQEDVDNMLDILTYHRIEQLLEKEQT